MHCGINSSITCIALMVNSVITEEQTTPMTELATTAEERKLPAQGQATPEKRTFVKVLHAANAKYQTLQTQRNEPHLQNGRQAQQLALSTMDNYAEDIGGSQAMWPQRKGILQFN